MADDGKKPGVWGIDLGQCALKAIRLEQDDGHIVATAFDYIEHPKILSQPDADPDQLTREALEKFLSRNDLKGDQIAISVPGQSGLARFVKLPPVDEKKIPDIVRFEAKQQIPFPLHEVVWGFQRLGSGTRNDNMVLDAEIGLFAMKRDMISRALQHFKDVGIEVHYIQMAPLALCNYLAHDLLGKGPANLSGEDDDNQSDKSCVVGLDIGADNSNLVITDGEKIIWQRPIPLGGNHFTRALTKDLKLTFAKAEHLKRNAVKSPDLKKILAALKPVLNDFVSEVQRSLGYFTNTHRDATIQYMVGLGNAFRLPGLQKYLQEKLQLEVRKLQKIERLEGEESVTEAPQYVENVLSFAVAHGLALQGLGASCIYTNLLPPEIAQERAIRAKKPWAVAAAAVLLLISPPLLFGWSAAVSGWKNDEVDKANAKLQAIAKEASDQVAAYKDAEGAVKSASSELLKLAGGVGERLNWVHIYNYINECLPRPDGTRLVETARDGSHPYARYFGDDKTNVGPGIDAWKGWKTLRDLEAQGLKLTKEQQEQEEEYKKNLVQVNIEAIAALYVEKLNDPANRFIGDSYKQSPDSTGQSMPTSGWVVELRGYTYNGGKDVFVRNTLVENMIELADITKDKGLIKKVQFHPDIKSVMRIKDAKDPTIPEKSRVTNVFLYEHYTDINPRPGAFSKIWKCYLGEKLNLWGVPQPPPPPVLEKKDDPDYKPPPPAPIRSAWRPPSGTKVGDSFGVGALANAPLPGQFNPGSQRGGPIPQAKGPVAYDPNAGAAPVAVASRRLPRTEFIVWFVWQEPVTQF